AACRQQHGVSFSRPGFGPRNLARPERWLARRDGHFPGTRGGTFLEQGGGSGYRRRDGLRSPEAFEQRRSSLHDVVDRASALGGIGAGSEFEQVFRPASRCRSDGCWILFLVGNAEQLEFSGWTFLCWNVEPLEVRVEHGSLQDRAFYNAMKAG